MPTSAWLMGAYHSMPAQTLTVAGTPVVVAAGNYYLFDAIAGKSLLTTVAAALGAAGVTSPTAVLMRNRKAKLSGTSSFSVTWGTATLLRDLLGFTGDMSSNSVHTATNRSKYLWSPGRPESPELAPLGSTGALVYDTAIGQSGPGTIHAVQHNSYRVNEYWWRFVDLAKVWTTSEAGGEYVAFYDSVLRKCWQWKLYRNVDEDDASSSTVSLGTPLGPYKHLPQGNGMFTYEREIEHVDSMSPIRIRCTQVPEFS